MSVRLLLVAMLFWLLYPLSIQADEPDKNSSPSTSRWGITTKKNLQGPPKAASDEPGSISDAKTETTATQSPTGKPDTPASGSPHTQTDPVGDAPANAGDATGIAPAQEKMPAKNQPPDSSVPSPKKPSTAEVGKETTTQPISWSSEEQKKRCNGQLKDLRSLFLKTRHYSIQGASCDTAESATEFLRTMETCKQNCPRGLLEQSGYTGRIIRNIKYLEKLGNDRCSGSLTPVPPVTQQP